MRKLLFVILSVVLVVSLVQPGFVRASETQEISDVCEPNRIDPENAIYADETENAYLYDHWQWGWMYQSDNGEYASLTKYISGPNNSLTGLYGTAIMYALGGTVDVDVLVWAGSESYIYEFELTSDTGFTPYVIGFPPDVVARLSNGQPMYMKISWQPQSATSGYLRLSFASLLVCRSTLLERWHLALPVIRYKY